MRITNKEQLAAHGNREGRKIVAELLDAGLDALDPYVRVKQLVHVENGKIVLHTDGFEMKGDPHAGPLEFDLNDYDLSLIHISYRSAVFLRSDPSALHIEQMIVRTTL